MALENVCSRATHASGTDFPMLKVLCQAGLTPGTTISNCYFMFRVKGLGSRAQQNPEPRLS